jgi:hypothetical protein
MANPDLIKKIKAGITKSGFPLELKIGSILEKIIRLIQLATSTKTLKQESIVSPILQRKIKQMELLSTYLWSARNQPTHK